MVSTYMLEAHDRNFLTGVAIDNHRLSSSDAVEKVENFSSLILPRKTVYQLCSLLTEMNEKLTMQSSDNKIKFSLDK